MVTPLLIQKAIIVLGPTVIAVSTHHTHIHTPTLTQLNFKMVMRRSILIERGV